MMIDRLASFRRSVPLTVVLLLVAGATVHAQEPIGRDYYNPGTAQVDRQLFDNVHRYHVQPGINDMRPGRYEAALENFEFILRVYPNDPQILNLVSELCVVKWRSPKCDADSWFERAVTVNPDIATTYVVYGIHLQRQRRRADAIQMLEKGLKLDPVSMNAHYNIGLAYFDQRQFALSNEHAQAAYALGAPLPGLRDMLKKAGYWDPSANALDRNGASK
jgi:tetratricopeptide (TPR) repeat protein